MVFIIHVVGAVQLKKFKYTVAEILRFPFLIYWESWNMSTLPIFFTFI